jgi:hypothetical protein
MDISGAMVEDRQTMRSKPSGETVVIKWLSKKCYREKEADLGHSYAERRN